ncbi:AAA family ATPase [Virgibacillus kekensis]|uniref:AAA family ATPase n=1 Tax=Virgibacillus kekensis TaxID=202261 RepID=A0ABV9DKK9_9BACI
MQLKQAKIYGFGKWVDQTINFSDDPFLCIYGENESGKSTLQQFILFMLFGLPPKKRSFYRPKQSGKLGGRLTIIEGTGTEFTIERLDEVNNGAAACYTPDGKLHSEEWLQERLQGMTHSTYQSIFSFSALDLANIKDMKEEELSEVVLGIGLTGSKRIQTIEKSLDSKIADLFKPTGKKPEINVQLDELEQLSTSLNKYKETAFTYRDKKNELHNLTETIRRRLIDLKQTRQVLFNNEKTQQALPVIKAYKRDHRLLADYPRHISFPENGLARLEQLQKEMLPLESELAVLKDNQDKYKDKQKSVRAQLCSEGVYDQAQQLINGKNNYTETENELLRLQESIKKIELELDNEIARLDIGLTREQLTTLVLPFHTEKTWQELKDSRHQLNLEKEKLRQEQSQLTRNRDYLLEERSKLNADKLEDADIKELSRRLDVYMRHEYQEQARKETVGQLTKWKKVNDQKEKNARLWLFGSIVAAVLVALLAMVLNQPLAYGISVLVFAVGFMQWAAGRRSSRELGDILQDKEVSSGEVTAEERLEAEELLERNRETEKELAGIREQLRTNDIQELQLEEKENALEQKDLRLQEQIDLQYDRFPFLKHVDLSYWTELLHTLKQLVSMESKRKQLIEQYTVLSGKKDNFREELELFYKQIGWKVTDKSIDDLFKAVDNLITDYNAQLKNIDYYKELLESNEDSIRTVTKKMKVYQSEINNLLSYAGVGSAEEFLAQGKQLAEKQEIEARIAQQMEQLATILPEWNIDQVMKQAVPSGSELEVQHKEYSEKIVQLERELEEMRQQRADLKAELSALESSESYSETVHRFSMEQDRLQQLAKRWSIYKSARDMLAETKRNYRDKYLESVVERTEAYFENLTGGRYQRVFAPEDNKSFQVESDEGVRYRAQELSQGTVEQLYVALRLGISEVMSEKHRLPFIIDDAFVHFDTVRTSRAVKMLKETSRSQQVILFTCKRDIADYAGDKNVITLMNSVRINQP